MFGRRAAARGEALGIELEEAHPPLLGADTVRDTELHQLLTADRADPRVFCRIPLLYVFERVTVAELQGQDYRPPVLWWSGLPSGLGSPGRSPWPAADVRCARDRCGDPVH